MLNYFSSGHVYVARLILWLKQAKQTSPLHPEGDEVAVTASQVVEAEVGCRDKQRGKYSHTH